MRVYEAIVGGFGDEEVIGIFSTREKTEQALRNNKRWQHEWKQLQTASKNADIGIPDDPFYENIHEYEVDDPRALGNSGINEPQSSECKIPPDGWQCTRLIGHTGPCTSTKREILLVAELDALYSHNQKIRLRTKAEQHVLDAMAAIPDDDLEPCFKPGATVVTSGTFDVTEAIGLALDAELTRRKLTQNE